MPWCRERNVPIMAYSPIEQGRLLKKSALKKIASRQGVTPSQVALAWVLRHDDVIAIPKAAKPEHVQDNHRALDLRLLKHDFLELDEAFPPPSKGFHWKRSEFNQSKTSRFPLYRTCK